MSTECAWWIWGGIATVLLFLFAMSFDFNWTKRENFIIRIVAILWLAPVALRAYLMVLAA